MNLVILAGILRVFRSMRRGEYDEAELERQLDNRGFFYRFFGRWMRVIDKEWKIYPVGVLFGLGFDTATEVLLLGTTAFLASQHLPWYAIICLPVLFTAGMTVMDTTDGIFMNLAYGWAFLNPVRKVYYNLAITGPLGRDLLPRRRHRDAGPDPRRTSRDSATTHGFWGFMRNFNINMAGFAIVGLFIVTWVAALLVWRYGRIEERWGANLDDRQPARGQQRAQLAGADRPAAWISMSRSAPRFVTRLRSSGPVIIPPSTTIAWPLT